MKVINTEHSMMSNSMMDVLDFAEGNTGVAARVLRLPRKMLRKTAKKLGIPTTSQKHWLVNQ